MLLNDGNTMQKVIGYIPGQLEVMPFVAISFQMVLENSSLPYLPKYPIYSQRSILVIQFWKIVRTRARFLQNSPRVRRTCDPV